MFVGVGASRIRNLFSASTWSVTIRATAWRGIRLNSSFCDLQKRQKLMLPASSSSMSWTVWAERGSSLRCIPIPGKPSTSCWLKWTGGWYQPSRQHLYLSESGQKLTCTWMFYRFKPNEGVIVIGATNFAEALDKYDSILNRLFLFRISN